MSPFTKDHVTHNPDYDDVERMAYAAGANECLFMINAGDTPPKVEPKQDAPSFAKAYASGFNQMVEKYNKQSHPFGLGEKFGVEKYAGITSSGFCLRTQGAGTDFLMAHNEDETKKARRIIKGLLENHSGDILSNDNERFKGIRNGVIISVADDMAIKISISGANAVLHF